MSRHFSVFLLSVLLFLGMLSFTPAVSAQSPEPSPLTIEATPLPPVPSDAINLTLSPVTINLVTKPGETTKTDLRIRNNSSQRESLHLTLGTFTADETGSKPRLLEAPANTEAFSWITFDQPSFEVEPGEWKTVTMTFSPPAHAALTYYYTVMVERGREAAAQPGEAAYQGAPAFLVLTTVLSPHAKQELQLVDFFSKHRIVEYLPQEFRFTVKNTGNIHLAPTGNIFIDGQGKKDLAILSINPEQNLVLPGSQREYIVDWSDGFPVYQMPSNKNEAETKPELKWDFSQADRWRFGKYTANLLMVYDNGERDVPYESSITFWVLPWKIMLVAGGIILLTVVGLLVIVRSVWRSVRHK